MCGICGIVDWENKDQREVVESMCNTLLHRGPDSRGIKQLDGCCLGHQRLAIIDLSPTGFQPMCNENSSIWIVFNGEIYNYRELREELMQDGHVFCSTSDTEVILHGYESWGMMDLCQRLVGMFAFAIWDQNKEKLYLARDRFGEKPLFYLRSSKQIRFASNTRSLFIALQERPKLNPDSVVAYLNLNYCLPQYSIFQDVITVLPATYVEVSTDREVPHSYWNISAIQKPEFSVDEWLNKLEAALKTTIGNQLIADVPVGCLLSGGVDSSLIASIAKESNRDIQLFTVRMSDPLLDESLKAKRIAGKIGAKHHILEALPVSLDEFVVFQQTFSQPLGDSSSIAQWLIAKYARNYVKVVLTGDGGDELFAGYNRIAINMRLAKYREFFAGPIARKGLSFFESRILPFNSVPLFRKFSTFSRLVKGSFSQMFVEGTFIHQDAQSKLWGSEIISAAKRKNYQGTLTNFWSELDGFEPLDRLLKVDMMMNLASDYLPKVDTAMMACSLESRAPFLDHTIAELAFSIPAKLKICKGTPKYLLKALLKRRLGNTANESVRHKYGFELPIDIWLNGEWSQLNDSLINSPLISEGVLDKAGVDYVIKMMNIRPKEFSRLRYSLIAMDIWYRGIVK